MSFHLHSNYLGFQLVATANAPKLIQGNHGSDSRILIYDGYKYLVNKKRNTRMYWRCCTTDCRSFLKTKVFIVYDFNAVIRAVNYIDNHGHAKDGVGIERLYIMNLMKDVIIANPTILVKPAYDDVVARLHQNAGAVGRLPSDIPDFDSI